MFREIINFKNVCYQYPRSNKNALEEINFSVMEGEFLAVMGENGAGKTTFCKLVNGIIPHFTGGNLSGNVTVDGEITNESSVARLSRKTGIVLDDPDAQLFTSTVRDEAAFGPENLLLSVVEINQRTKFALNAVGLEGFEDRYPATLSGGEKQRLSIAAALAMNTKILVMDEPLCRLDPQGVSEVMAVIKNLREKHQITVIMASHNSEVTAEFADRVCVLKDGRVAALDAAKNIFANNAFLEERGIQPLKKNKKILPRTNTNQHEPVIRDGSLIKNPAIEIRDFYFSYKDGVRFENINFSIADNDIAAIIGNNGCGKTTLLKNITGLLRPNAGEIYVRGRNIYNLSVSEISKEIGFIMQNPGSQLFTDSVFKEIAFALKTKRLTKTEIKQRVEDVLKIADLEDSEAFPHALSGSDRKKLVIACVLAMECKILIFDEIDLGLDYKEILKIMSIVRNLHSRGFTIIFVTHNMSLAAEYADKIIKLERTGALERKNT